MNSKTRLLSSEIIFDHPYVKILVDTLLHHGREKEYLYLVSPVEAVAIIGLNSDGEILLTRQYRHPIRKVIYDLPAGSLLPGEQPLHGARREFEEETGYYPNHIHQIGYYNQFPGMLRAAINLFFATDLTPTAQNLDEGEVLEVVCMPVEQVLEMIKQGEFIDGSLQLVPNQLNSCTMSKKM